MHIHILGICGTFMGGLAVLAKELGYKVTGSDANVYPPMSDQLESLGIELMSGYLVEHLQPEPDLVVIGNALSRGNEAVEYVLDKNIPYVSGPQWLFEHVLKDKWVLAASGTHGKTTTSSMLAWILEDNGCKPGFLIGGIANNFGISARLGDSIFFVIEADEYDSAFFDKRSKFVHYHPRTLIVNNLEFDHADIFDNLAAIQKQFNHLLRIVPSTGLVISPADDINAQEMIKLGCWSEEQQLGKDWTFSAINPDYSQFEVYFEQEKQGELNWNLLGKHNAHNAVMAIAAARHVGVKPKDAIAALTQFQNVKRRLELKGEVNHVRVYDDFAHHPTAIATTLDGLKNNINTGKIIAVLEPRSNTMKMGVHKQELANSLTQADLVFMLEPVGMNWSLNEVAQACQQTCVVKNTLEDVIDSVLQHVSKGDHILVMSNGGFGGIHNKLLDKLDTHEFC